MQHTTETAISSELRRVLKRLHYPLEVRLTCMRWYVAYTLSLRQSGSRLTPHQVV